MRWLIVRAHLGDAKLMNAKLINVGGHLNVVKIVTKVGNDGIVFEEFSIENWALLQARDSNCALMGLRLVETNQNNVDKCCDLCVCMCFCLCVDRVVCLCYE
jgi:hypothetical protein